MCSWSFVEISILDLILRLSMGSRANLCREGWVIREIE